MARTALFAPSVLSSAASGHRLPTLAVTLAFASACGGDRRIWEQRWREVAQQVGPAAEARDERGRTGVRPGELLPVEPAGTGSFTGQQPTGYPVPPAQLPPGSSTFVGRSRQLQQALALLRSPGPVKAPLMISGPIGTGKKALALRIADEVAEEYPDGALYADLGDHGPDQRCADDIVRGFLHALGIADAAVPGDPVQRVGLYRSQLAQRRLFILLTGVRDERSIRPLLGQTARSTVVLTSRTRLLGLDDTNRMDLTGFDRVESIELLSRLIGADRVAAEPEATEAVAELCGDLPLAINIIGRRIAARPEWAIAYTAGRLTDPNRLLECLTVGDVTVADRIATAYQHLTPAARHALHLFDALGKWATAIGLAAAMGVLLETADELLEALVDAGLLSRANVAGRYSVSRLVSVYAAQVQREALPDADPLTDRRARRAEHGSARQEPAPDQVAPSGTDIDCSTPTALPVNLVRRLNDSSMSRATMET